MRRTKIVCTLGPASNSPKAVAQLIQSGMDVARLNFSHGDPDMHGDVLQTVRSASAKAGRPVGVLQDLPGPKIRIGKIRHGSALVESGSTVRITSEEVEGDAGLISLPHPGVVSAIKPGASLYLADGLLHLKVTECDRDGVTAKVLTGGMLGSNKGVNLPDSNIELSAATERDIELFRFGMSLGVDWAAVSFVGSADDVKPFRDEAEKAGNRVKLLAKVERKSSLRHLDEIVEAFDGVLVARGDLGIETPIRDIPIVQKTLVQKCNKAGKPVIVATQMLMSMVSNPRPTRAEATDVANAILDGADAVMLSEETAVGQYPCEAVQIMSQIASSTEQYMLGDRLSKRPKTLVKAKSRTVNDSIGFSAARLAEDLGCSAVIACTATGETARAVSKHRPAVPICAAASSEEACRQLTLSWGVMPFLVHRASDIDEMINTAVKGAEGIKVVKSNDWVIILAGVCAGIPGNTSLIKYHRIGDSIWG